MPLLLNGTCRYHGVEYAFLCILFNLNLNRNDVCICVAEVTVFLIFRCLDSDSNGYLDFKASIKHYVLCLQYKKYALTIPKLSFFARVFSKI
jgi:hypothetical protein